ncbi:MAG: hypothetical protein KA715_00395 [Xanthomonadaceae bacterium]|nr:hypothetical protein [Xanthomonadaceae bacterium]
MIALFQELGVSAANFPFSRSSLHSTSVQREKRDSLIGSRIIRHFIHFTPSQTLPSSVCYNKKIIFIDFTATGESLSKFESALFFVKKHHSELYEHEPFLLALTGRELPFQMLESNNINYMEVGTDLFKELNYSSYDKLREFDVWLATMEKYSYASKDAYRSFRKSIKRQLEADEKFCTRLRTALETGEIKFNFCEKLLYTFGY